MKLKDSSITVRLDPIEVIKADEGDRTFEGWGSVEVVDKQGEKLPIDDIMKTMPVYIRRGGVLHDMHTNKHVGSVVKYNEQDHEEN